MTAIFLQGDARRVLQGLPADFFHCCVTSPPYYGGLRQYKGGALVWGGKESCEHEWGDEILKIGAHHAGETNPGKEGYTKNRERWCKTVGQFCVVCDAWQGQLGGESSPDLYVQHLVDICREVKRVLRPDGVFWLNIGDSWAANRVYQVRQTKWRGMDGQEGAPSVVPAGCKPLDMVLIPSLLALALRADGWYVRSLIVWAKGVSDSEEFDGNPMPESPDGWRWVKHRVKVKASARADSNSYHGSEWRDCPGCPKCSPHDGLVLRRGNWRPTDSWEHVLMLAKSVPYYTDKYAVMESAVYPVGEKRRGGCNHVSLLSGSRTTAGRHDHDKDWDGDGKRNLRSVWEIPTVGLLSAFRGKHFAAFPERLAEICLRAATSERGCCPTCGSPWARIVEKGLASHSADTQCLFPVGDNVNRIALLRQAARANGEEYHASVSTVGWLPTCSCPDTSPIPCRVLDPFSGAGTVAVVADRLGLDSIGIDVAEDYIGLARARVDAERTKR